MELKDCDFCLVAWNIHVTYRLILSVSVEDKLSYAGLLQMMESLRQPVLLVNGGLFASSTP